MTVSLYSLFGTEKKLEENGSWIPIPDSGFPEDRCPEFLVKRVGGVNCPFSREVERLLAPHRARNRKLRKTEDDVSVDLRVWATKEAFVKVVLVGWKNIPMDMRSVDTDGEMLEYSTANAKQLMDDMPQLCEFLINEAQELKNYQEEDREDDAKNS